MVGISIIFDVVSSDWSIQGMLWNVHAVHEIVSLASNFFDKLMSLWSQLCNSLVAKDSLYHVEAEISLDNLSSEEQVNFLH